DAQVEEHYERLKSQLHPSTQAEKLKKECREKGVSLDLQSKGSFFVQRDKMREKAEETVIGKPIKISDAIRKSRCLAFISAQKEQV
ncbi:hypothetical protein ABTN01_19710, partial [Acinetobacter baumannii]